MAMLEPMPRVHVPQGVLQDWGTKWLVTQAFSKKDSMQFGNIFNNAVGSALAAMLGGLGVVEPSSKALLPSHPDVVEIGDVRIVGGIRPQNYDVGYRPDGVRFAFDGKTLNDAKSVRKNFQNMVNDLGTEATTIHMRFPHAVVGFMVVIPTPCFEGAVRRRFTSLLNLLVGRQSPLDSVHKAEAMSLVLWNPSDGTIDAEWPPAGSLLRIEQFSERVQSAYYERYDGLPPHDRPSSAQQQALAASGVDLTELDDPDAEENGATAGDE